MVSAAALLAASSQTAPLKLVSTAWPPFTNPPGQPRFALDLVEAALTRIGVRAETTIVSAAEFTPSLLTGPFDGSAAAWQDPERERVLLLSQPYLENRLVLVGRSGGDTSAAALSDLRGKRVAIVEGYAYGDAIDTAGPVFVRSSSEEDSLTQLLAGRVDYTLMDELVVKHIVNTYPEQSATRLQIGSKPLVTRQLFLAVRRTRPDAESIISGFNAQLQGMVADRTYHRLLHLDWITADVNGDGLFEYVPSDDAPGPKEPQQVYSLLSASGPPSTATTKPGFYLGGNIYSDWLTVPDYYKVVYANRENPSRSTASIFNFKW
jgi:polar amino acid transport system substrate-binding protein